jgi:hypothetical protein
MVACECLYVLMQQKRGGGGFGVWRIGWGGLKFIEVIALKLETRTDSEKGLLHYHSHEFRKAVNYFKRVREADPSDKAARLYTKRATRFMIHGVPEGWEGTEILQSQ